jgi:hypothetical protein
MTHNAESLNIGQTRPLASNGLAIIQLRGVKERPQPRMQLLSNDPLQIYRVFYELLTLLYEMISYIKSYSDKCTLYYLLFNWNYLFIYLKITNYFRRLCDQKLQPTWALFSMVMALWVFKILVNALLWTASHNPVQSAIHYAILNNHWFCRWKAVMQTGLRLFTSVPRGLLTTSDEDSLQLRVEIPKSCVKNWSV